MCMLVLYISIAFVMMYTDVLDSYRCKVKFKFKESLIFSLFWVVSIPCSVYLIWKESK